MPNRRVIQCEARGRLDRVMADQYREALDRFVALADGPLLSFNDWERVADYDDAVRGDLTQWAVANRPRFEAVHFLLGSRLVEWGFRVANVALAGFMVATHDRAEFEAQLRAALG
jgi:hypothetical protein